jgi:hypothetical protein
MAAEASDAVRNYRRRREALMAAAYPFPPFNGQRARPASA